MSNKSRTEAGAAFRRELRAWLDANIPAEWRRPGFWHVMDEAKSLEMRRAWEQTKCDAGWAGIDWPREYGGRGGSALERAIYEEEMALANAPETVNPQIPIIGPSLLLFGEEWQKQRFIRPMLRCEEIWCQGFSEPEAGSDLASLKTRARRDGEDWVLNGQKIWTSLATISQWCFLLARTNSEVKKHAGLTLFLIDLKTPGMTVRGIRHMTGRNEFAELFLDDVRVPNANVVGGVDNGWKVINGLLKEERAARAGAFATFQRHLQLVVEFMRQGQRGDRAPAGGGRALAEDPILRQKLGAVCVDMELLRIHSLETMQSMAAGTSGDADAPLTKYFSAEVHQDMGEVFADAAGAAWHLLRPDPRLGEVDEGLLRELQFVFLRARAETISGGSAQIQRNIIGERVLGLPR
jgi:alkylation response protein AidB-like acyl-CoA dehydrogenase